MSSKKSVEGELFPAELREDPITHRLMCDACWNGKHVKGGCRADGCECGCYSGANVSTSGLVKPEKDQERFKVGTIPV